jgi:hypothetical protein
VWRKAIQGVPAHSRSFPVASQTIGFTQIALVDPTQNLFSPSHPPSSKISPATPSGFLNPSTNEARIFPYPLSFLFPFEDLLSSSSEGS